MAKNLGQLIKNSWKKEFKVQASKLITLYFSNPKLFIKTWQEKKNHYKHEQQDQQSQKSSITATGVNTTKPDKTNKKKNNNQN